MVLLITGSFEETDGDTNLSVKETGPVGTLLHFFSFWADLSHDPLLHSSLWWAGPLVLS